MSQFQSIEPTLTDRQLRQLHKVVFQGRYLLGIAADGADPAKVRQQWELLKRQADALVRTKDRKPSGETA